MFDSTKMSTLINSELGDLPSGGGKPIFVTSGPDWKTRWVTRTRTRIGNTLPFLLPRQ